MLKFSTIVLPFISGADNILIQESDTVQLYLESTPIGKLSSSPVFLTMAFFWSSDKDIEIRLSTSFWITVRVAFFSGSFFEMRVTLACLSPPVSFLSTAILRLFLSTGEKENPFSEVLSRLHSTLVLTAIVYSALFLLNSSMLFVKVMYSPIPFWIMVILFVIWSISLISIVPVRLSSEGL